MEEGKIKIKQKLGELAQAQKASIVKEEPPSVWVRVYPKSSASNGQLARNVAEVAARESWQIEELHTEEGRLDEVFRRITSPDTGIAAAPSREEA